jgi:short-subunit dehydrogenase
MRQDLSGRVVAVTGAARGIGAELVLRGPAARRVPELEAEVRALGRAFGTQSAALSATSPDENPER